MSYDVVWTKKAAKELMSLPKQQRLMVATWVRNNLQGCSNPKTIPGSKAIQDSRQDWRYRVGSYRVLVHIEEGELIIETVRVGHRQGVYSNLPKM